MRPAVANNAEELDMPETMIDGFRFQEWAGGKLLLSVESHRLDEYVAYCNAKKIAWLDISSYHWYGLDDVDFLRDCPSVTGIHMQGGFASYAGLSTLPQLRSLSVIFEHDIDFAALPHLE